MKPSFSFFSAFCLLQKYDGMRLRHWDFTTNIADIVCYLPVPMVALRTLKSEVLVGLKPEVIKELAKSDSSWLTNGQWGVIQLVV